MTQAIALEAFLARLYTDEALRRDFVAAPEQVARAHGLDADTVAGLAGIDRDGLELTAHSLAARRSPARGHAAPGSWLQRWSPGRRGG